jgi:hypothetical protein
MEVVLCLVIHSHNHRPLRPPFAAADGQQTASPSAWRTSVGSSDASGRPADADADVWTRDNPRPNGG